LHAPQSDISKVKAIKKALKEELAGLEGSPAYNDIMNSLDSTIATMEKTSNRKAIVEQLENTIDLLYDAQLDRYAETLDQIVFKYAIVISPTKSYLGPMRTDSKSVYYKKRQEGMSDREAREYVLEHAPWEMTAEFPEDIPLEPAALGRGGKLVPSKSVTASEVRSIIADARFDVDPYARTYIDALDDSEAMYGEHGVEVQAAYIATNLRAKTPEQKEAKKLLQRIADGKYTGKKVVR
jgi:hypothetical protein